MCRMLSSFLQRMTVVSPTWHTSEDLSSRSELTSSTQEHAQPITAVFIASITGSDSQYAQDQ